MDSRRVGRVSSGACNSAPDGEQRRLCLLWKRSQLERPAAPDLRGRLAHEPCRRGGQSRKPDIQRQGRHRRPSTYVHLGSASESSDDPLFAERPSLRLECQRQRPILPQRDYSGPPVTVSGNYAINNTETSAPTNAIQDNGPSGTCSGETPCSELPLSFIGNTNVRSTSGTR